MDNPIGADAAKLAGLQIDLLQKVRNGQLALEQLEWWLKLSAADRARYMQPEFYDVVLGLATIVRANFRLALDKPFSPSDFIGKGWSVWKGTADGDGLQGEEDVVPEPDAMDFERLVVETHLLGDETSILGEEKMKRARAGKNRQLGGRSALALWNNWEACKATGKPEDSVLEKLYKAKKIGDVIYFFGLALRSSDGNRCVLCLYRNDRGYWRRRCGWLGARWDAGNPSVSLASVEVQS